jgi:hypothetical protein
MKATLNLLASLFTLEATLTRLFQESAWVLPLVAHALYSLHTVSGQHAMQETFVLQG